MKFTLWLWLLALWLGWFAGGNSPADEFQGNWRHVHDRVWAGENWWANRLQDWQVSDGRLQCIATARDLPLRTAHLISHRIDDAAKGVNVSLSLGLAVSRERLVADSMAGLLLGAGDGKMDSRAAALIHQVGGPGAGIFFGVDAGGNLVVHDLETTAMLPAPQGALARDKWKLVSVDSFEPGSEGQRAWDGDAQTVWHTQWVDEKPPHPHRIVIDLGEQTEFDGFAYLPRQGQGAGRMDAWEFYATSEPDGFDQPLAGGRFLDNEQLQSVQLPRTRARFVQLVALSSHHSRPSTTVAELFLTSRREHLLEAEPQREKIDPGSVELSLHIHPFDDRHVEVVFSGKGHALDQPDVAVLVQRHLLLEPGQLQGNVALVSHPGSENSDMQARYGRFWFEEFKLGGGGVRDQQIRFGPVAAVQYTLDRQILKLTAQLMPLGENESAPVTLERLSDNNQWEPIGSAEIVVPGYTAAFRIPDWDDKRDWNCRLSFFPTRKDLPPAATHYELVVRENPVDKETLTIAGLSCNQICAHGLVRGQRRDHGGWPGSVWFPHRQTVQAIQWHQPDLLMFLGDQIYEGDSPTFADRSNLHLDYLYKWYLWCWAFGELTRQAPCITLPDDHDVYQGNLWGESGRPASRDNEGGYVHSAEFVKMVERTQTSHLPDPVDPRPVRQGIGVHFTSMNYGRVSFAILEDRKFKSGCGGGRLPASGSNRPDHISDPQFDVRLADLPDLQLLGDRQMKFLDQWARDWRDAEMKLAVSQTPFGNMATHHGPNLDYLRADLDSNGWPQTGRRRAVEALRRARAFHVAGDQHLAMLAQHGIQQHRDAIWSFAVPAIANFYPRKWDPPSAGANRPNGAPRWMGDHIDGLGNLVSVFAAANPFVESGVEPRELHDKMVGYGIIKLQKPQREITFQCWPSFVDPANSSRQFAGWPVTIHQSDNDGRTPIGYLPPIRLSGTVDPVVHLVHQDSGELVYAFRARGTTVQLPVFQQGPHTVHIGQQPGQMQTIADLEPGARQGREPIVVDLAGQR